jgi:hypothetical protein
MDNTDIEAGCGNHNESRRKTNDNKPTGKSWFMRIMSVLLTDKAIRMRGGKRAGNDYYEIV